MARRLSEALKEPAESFEEWGAFREALRQPVRFRKPVLGAKRA